MEQNTEAWLAWRGNGLGSSDAAVIMGESPYKTPYRLWLEMTGRAQPETEKFAFALGHRAEPFIRALAEERLGEQYEPSLAASRQYPFMQASLDGRNMTYTSLMEIKVNPEDVHVLLPSKPEVLPRMHFWQMQHQLITTEAERCYYVSAPYRDDFADLTVDDLNIIETLPLAAARLDLIEAEGRFIECLATDTPPPLNERDGIHVRSASWKRNAAEWLKLKAQIAALKQKQDRAAARLKEMADGASLAHGYGVIVKNTVTKGRLLTNKIPELKDVDLDKYRASSSIKTTVGED